MTTEVATGRSLHPARVAGRSIAAALLKSAKEALVARGDHSATGRAIAQRRAPRAKPVRVRKAPPAAPAPVPAHPIAVIRAAIARRAAR